MKVRRLFHPVAAYATPAESLREAARKMRGRGLSCLPIMQGKTVIGIVTERDMVEAMANGVAPGAAPVSDYMNDGSVTVTLDDDCEVAQLKMLAVGCRHLPVLDRGELVGMISARDLLLTRAFAGGEPVPALTSAATTPGGWPDEPPPDVDSER